MSLTTRCNLKSKKTTDRILAPRRQLRERFVGASALDVRNNELGGVNKGDAAAFSEQGVGKEVHRDHRLLLEFDKALITRKIRKIGSPHHTDMAKVKALEIAIMALVEHHEHRHHFACIHLPLPFRDGKPHLFDVVRPILLEGFIKIVDMAKDFGSIHPKDPVRSTSSGTPRRVFRGGGWNSNARLVRSAIRYNYAPSHRFSNLGFRLLRP